jgi:hypothetical protein
MTNKAKQGGIPLNHNTIFKQFTQIKHPKTKEYVKIDRVLGRIVGYSKKSYGLPIIGSFKDCENL